MKCVGFQMSSYIAGSDLSVMDHMINMGRMIIAARKCQCDKCRVAASMANETGHAGELGRLAVNVEMTRRNNPVKVFTALVEGWTAEQILAEFGDK